MSAKNQIEPQLKMIPVANIRPNNFNPNRMSKFKFDEYVAEVRRLNRLPKPSVVRPLSGDTEQYEIVDGEHGVRAAKEVGFDKVPCEVVEIGDFEAMLQCDKRNRGGTNDPVLLGRMYRKMKAVGDKKKTMSNRQLADRVDQSEGTIRRYLDYAKACDLRSGHAGQDGHKEIAKLRYDSVKMYLRLPEELRDKWLDAGGDVSDLEALYEHDVSQLVSLIREAGLFHVIEGSFVGFSPSLRYALELATWRQQNPHLQGVGAYVQAVAELRLPAWVLDLLPCETGGDDTAAVLLSREKWASILTTAQEHAGNTDGIFAQVESGVRIALRDAGVDLSAVLGPQVAEVVQLLMEAPTFIHEADHLTLEEKFQLHTLEVDADAELLLRAKMATVDHFGQVRQPKGKEVRTRGAPRSIKEIFAECLDRLRHERHRADEDELFADRAVLAEATCERMSESSAIRDGVIKGESAAEVLAQRLRTVETPELALLAKAVLDSETVEDIGKRWLRAMTASPKDAAAKSPDVKSKGQ